MSDKNNIPSVTELFTLEPAEVQSWLDSVLSCRERLPKDFNWRLLAENSAHLARWSDDVEWARVGIRVYDWLHSLDPHHNDSSMTLRAYFIERLGGVSNDPLLDPNVILRWFYENLPMSFVEAEQGIPKCTETIAKGNIQGPDDLQLCRELRQIKNKLNIIALLVESEAVCPDNELQKWLEIRTKIP